MVSKDILVQYSDLQEEIKDVRRRIGELEKQIAAFEEKGYSEIDKVRGGEGGLQSFKIEGFPYAKYSKKKTLLYSRKAILETLELDLLEMTNDVEAYIASVNNSEMRRILTMRFIDNMNFEQIGKILGYDRTSISKKIDKFISE
jgi:hypothetical protein